MPVRITERDRLVLNVLLRGIMDVKTVQQKLDEGRHGLLMNNVYATFTSLKRKGMVEISMGVKHLPDGTSKTVKLYGITTLGRFLLTGTIID